MKFATSAVMAVSFGASFAIAWDKDAPSYTTPQNTNNTCTSQQGSGFDWSSQSTGPMGSYGGFDFQGYSCANSFGKRGGGASMGGKGSSNGFQSKCITGNAGQSSGPSFSCSSHEFSIDHMQVTTEHDTNLECHYTMPDNSICKSSHSCSSKGTTIQNSQCGGAKAVSIVVPSAQPTPTCSFAVHSVGFNCGTASYTPPVATYSAHSSTSVSSSVKSVQTESSKAESSHTSGVSTSSKPTSSVAMTSSLPAPPTISISYSSVAKTSVPVKSVPVGSVPASSVPASSVPASSVPASSVPASSVPASSVPASSVPASSIPASSIPASSIPASSIPASSIPASSIPASSIPASSVPASSAPQSSSPVFSTSVPGGSSLSISYSMPGNSSLPQSSSPVSTSAPSPSIITTEIVYTTTTSCSSGHEVTTVLSSPSLSTIVTSTAKPVVTTPTSGPPTTITSYETFTTTSSCSAGQTIKSTLTAPSVITSTIKSTTVISVTVPTQGTTTATGSAPASSASVSSAPASSAPASSASIPSPAAPSVLPRCLNSFPATGCNGNTDSSCYCKDAQFITNAISCANAHGADNDEIAQAISFLQGICAPHIPQNPAIVTAVPSTITVTPVAASTAAPVASGPVTQAPALPMTTVTLSTTVTMPCSACEQASISTINTVVTCPQVSFATGSASSVSLMPATTFAAPIPGPTAPAPAPVSGSAPAPAPISGSTVAPVASNGAPSISTAAPVASSILAPSYGAPVPSASVAMSAPIYTATEATSPVQTVPAGVPAYGGTGTSAANLPYATGAYGASATKPLAYLGAATKNTAGGIIAAFAGVVAMFLL